MLKSLLCATSMFSTVILAYWLGGGEFERGLRLFYTFVAGVVLFLTVYIICRSEV
jgi:hypothetical protein